MAPPMVELNLADVAADFQAPGDHMSLAIMSLSIKHQSPFVSWCEEECMLVTPFGKPLNRRFSIPGQALGSGFFYVYFFCHAFILALEVLLMVICNWSQRDFKVPVILRVRRLIAQRVVALWLWVSGTTTFQRHLPWVLTRQALLHALLRFWACWKLNETLVLSNDNFHQSHSWWWQGLWKYDVWWYYWSHDHGFVRQGVAVPEAAVTLQQAIPEEEQTVTIKLQGLKRKRVTVTITDDKAEFIWKGLNLKRYRIWKAYKVFSLTSFHQILKLKNVASGKWK